ncbi:MULTISPECIES: hypothetical protein [Nostocales]|uniref:Uncharacterized protein n=3 Tax=Nostocales TaxID=1161 RepID=A0A8S9SX52_9CYAN|nr:hypothetical protein [Tolypothrix bouteillei]KAF3884655.1 hypothetical protein DA73_0400003575 [Tolypothrix bouteillei VB521301]
MKGSTAYQILMVLAHIQPGVAGLGGNYGDREAQAVLSLSKSKLALSLP